MIIEYYRPQIQYFGHFIPRWFTPKYVLFIFSQRCIIGKTDQRIFLKIQKDLDASAQKYLVF